jgi:hypothetical protein
MKVSLFVTSSAALLAMWLGVTFFREVPAEKYPKLGKGSLPLSARAKPEGESKPLISLEQEPEEPVVVVE